MAETVQFNLTPEEIHETGLAEVRRIVAEMDAVMRDTGFTGDRAAFAEHRAIVRAIAAGEPSAARAAMQRHLNQAYKRFSTGWNALQ